jgi:hypothetical protein
MDEKAIGTGGDLFDLTDFAGTDKGMLVASVLQRSNR